MNNISQSSDIEIEISSTADVAINEFLGEHADEKISCGHIVKAMILNGLGFVSAPLSTRIHASVARIQNELCATGE